MKIIFQLQRPQGDVEKVIRSWDQTIVASYSYDAWGNILTATGTLAERNPIRYRGYYYDTETGFYYLQSRYYDPQTGRFINADGAITTGQGLMSYNLFAYCLDNPVNGVDYSGSQMMYVDLMGGGVKERPFIHAQSSEPYSSIPFGDSTIGKTGCGPVALYNLLILLGQPNDFDDVINAFTKTNHSILLSSIEQEYYLGISKNGFSRAMEEMGIQFIGTNDFSYIINNSPTKFVVLYRNSDNLFSSRHFIAVHYDGIQYNVYNRYSNGTGVAVFSTLEGVLERKERFIYAYIPN